MLCYEGTRTHLLFWKELYALLACPENRYFVMKIYVYDLEKKWIPYKGVVESSAYLFHSWTWTMELVLYVA